MPNYVKYNKYKDLMEKLKDSIDNEFYYEAIFIEYAVIEDRTSSMLRHAKFSQDSCEKELFDKLKLIESSDKFKNEYVNKHLTKELLDSIHKWRIDRNNLIHDLVNKPYSNEHIKKVALTGYEFVKILNNKSSLINDYFDKTIKSILNKNNL